MNEPLLSAGDGETFKQRWEQIQVTFVDEPQTSVREADALVQELMQRLADSFAQERARLESSGSGASRPPPRTCGPPACLTSLSSVTGPTTRSSPCRAA